MKKNLNKLYEIMIFTGLIFGIIYIMAAGKMDYYLHPKMIKYVVFALVMLTLIDLYWVWEYMKAVGRPKTFRYSSLLLALPILFMAVFPSQISGSVLHNKVVKIGDGSTAEVSMTSDSVAGNENSTMDEPSSEGIDGITESELQALEEAALSPIDDSVVSLGDMDSTDLEEAASIEKTAEDVGTTDAGAEAMPEESPIAADSSVIVMDDFWDFLVAVYQDKEQMLGKTMEVEGFIFREDGFRSDTAIISRLVMSCCAADAYITGVFLKDDTVSGLTDDGWYRITGVLQEDEVYNPISDSYQVELVLTDLRAEAIEAYDNPYIYPE